MKKEEQPYVEPKELFTKEQALNVIKQICLTFRGTINEHNLIQKSIKLLEEK